MSLDEAVLLVEHAFDHGPARRPVHPQGAGQHDRGPGTAVAEAARASSPSCRSSAPGTARSSTRRWRLARNWPAPRTRATTSACRRRPRPELRRVLRRGDVGSRSSTTTTRTTPSASTSTGGEGTAVDASLRPPGAAAADERLHRACADSLDWLDCPPLCLPALRRLGIRGCPECSLVPRKSRVRGGGVAVAVVVACNAAALSAGGDAGGLVGLVVLVVAVAGVGFADDVRHPLPVGIRLLAQLVVGAGAATSLVQQTPHSGPTAVFVPVPVVVVGFAAYVNAFNFMDGVNGISGWCRCRSGPGTPTWPPTAEVPLQFPSRWQLWCGLSASCPGTRPRARVFLGDVGSTSSGALCRSRYIHLG